MNFSSQFIIFVFLPLLFLSGLSNGAPKVDHQKSASYVRNFVEEATKGLNLEKLSNYFVDFAHLNGFLMINKEQYEEIAEEEKADEANAVGNGPIEGMLSNGKHQNLRHKREANKKRKLVDSNNLSNHHSISVSSTLLPSPYPKQLFEMAKEVQKLMAELHLRASYDIPFLLKSTKETIKSDTLTAGMVKIMEKVEKEVRRNPISLILQRSDYLTDEDAHTKEIQLKQIEATNSIGKGSGWGHQISLMHKRILDKVKHAQVQLPELLTKAEIPQNEILEKQANALYQAWKKFNEIYSAPDAVILLISVTKRKHYCHFEQLLWSQFKLEDIAWAKGDNPLVKSITFEDMTHKLSVENENGKHHLYYQAEMGGNKRKVAIAHFQDGFKPEHFTRDEEWHIRGEMEMSTAIMSPNVYLHLMGSKTVQQELAKPGVTEKYLKGKYKLKLIKKLRSTFIEMWTLDGKDDGQFVEMAIKNPEGYVLKTNTDGGGGIYFEKEMTKILKGIRQNSSELSKYILQKRIKPFRIRNAIIPQPPIAESNIHIDEMDTEISIYGSLLAVTKKENGQLHHKIEFNDYDGYFGRTKLSSKAQCNISSGYGGADSLVLFAKDEFEHGNR